MTSLYTHYTNFNGAPRPFPFVPFVLPEATRSRPGFGLGETPRPPLPGKKMTMPFAIYRHEKIKTAQALTASANHMTRAADTPNADPTRAALTAS